MQDRFWVLRGHTETNSCCPSGNMTKCYSYPSPFISGVGKLEIRKHASSGLIYTPFKSYCYDYRRENLKWYRIGNILERTVLM